MKKVLAYHNERIYSVLLVDGDFVPTVDTSALSVFDGAELDVTAETHYVTGSPPAVTPRPSFSITQNKTSINSDGIDKSTFTGIPNGATVVISDLTGTTTLTADGTALDVTSEEPGTIAVGVSLFPYLPATFTVTAT